MKKKENELEKLGKNIAIYRHRIGISQDDLALEAEVGRRTINRIEVGATDPRYTTLSKIANTLGIEVRDLVNFDIERDTN